MAVRGIRSGLMRDLVDIAVAAGWRTEEGGKHLKVFPPDGPPIVISKTQAGRRSELNTRAMFRRAGLDV